MANQEGFPEKLKAARDKDGISFSEAAARANYSNALHQLEKVIVPPGKVASFVELHIEQGPFLEEDGRFLL